MSEAAPLIAVEIQEAPQIVEVPRPKPSMAWNAFLSRCMLWLTAALHLGQAVWIFQGGVYYKEEIRAAIYAGMPGMRVLDHAFAASLGIAAVLQVIAAVQLIRRRWVGAKLLKAAYALLALGAAGYLAVLLLISGLPPLSLPLAAQVILYAALLWINASYYRKRREGFSPAEGEHK